MRKKRTPQAPHRRHKAAGAPSKVPPPPDAGLQRDSSEAKRVIGRPFPKGVSGNPSGRRAGSVSPTAALKRILTRADAERIAHSLIALAAKGDPTALRVLFDRVDFPLAGPLAAALAAKSNPEVNGDGVVQFNIGLSESELEATAGRDDPVRVYLPAKEPIDTSALETLARGLFGIAPAAPKGNGATEKPAPAVPAVLALPAPPALPAPAAEPPAPPAPQPAAAKPKESLQPTPAQPMAWAAARSKRSKPEFGKRRDSPDTHPGGLETRFCELVRLSFKPACHSSAA